MPIPLVLISDSTGDLGERFIKALISQFPKESFDLQIHRFVEDDGKLSAVLSELKGGTPILFHTTIFPALKKSIASFARKRGISSYDITGEAMSFLEKASSLVSRPRPEAVHELN